MELKLVEKHEFKAQLSSSLLTSERQDEMYASYSGIRGDSDLVIDDDELLSGFEEIFKDDEIAIDTIQKLRSEEYSSLTKGFYHKKETFANLDPFLVREDNGIDKRYNRNVRTAISLLKSMMKVSKLKPITLTPSLDIFDLIANGDAVCGTICDGKKKDHPDVIRFYAELIKSRLSAGEKLSKVWIPAKVGHRGQISNVVGDDGKLNPMEEITEKDRLVWAIDGSTGVVEAQYSFPLTDWLTSIDFFSPGKEPHVQRELIWNARQSCSYWVGVDYSKFDGTIPRWLICVCFDIIKEFFDESYHRELNWIAYNFIHTRILLQGGMLVEKDHGIPSGSGFTQIVGTMANMLIMLSYLSSLVSGDDDSRDAWIRNQLRVGLPSEQHYGMFAQGDDNLMFVKFKVDTKHLSGYVHALFGVVVNPLKCDEGDKSKDPWYLKRWWTQFGEYCPVAYLIANTCHPEHYRDYKVYSKWHILYCLWLTYRLTFPKWVTEEYFILKMRENGGLDLLEKVPRNALPGIAKAFPRKYLRRITQRLLWKEKAVQAA